MDARKRGEPQPQQMVRFVMPNTIELVTDKSSMRLLPHDQDTGGFFVAVLERAGASQTSSLKRQASPVEGEAEIKRAREKSPAPAASAEAEAAPAAAAAAAESAVKAEKPVTTKKEKRDNSFKEDPYSYVDPSHAEVKAIM